MKTIILLCLLILIGAKASARDKIYLSATPVSSRVDIYKREHASDMLSPDQERTYKGMNGAGIGLMIGGVGMAVLGVNKILNAYATTGERVGKTMVAAGGVMLASGLVAHTFAQLKLEYANVKIQGNSFALTLPKTNKHFGL